MINDAFIFIQEIVSVIVTLECGMILEGCCQLYKHEVALWVCLSLTVILHRIAIFTHCLCKTCAIVVCIVAVRVKICEQERRKKYKSYSI